VEFIIHYRYRKIALLGKGVLNCDKLYVIFMNGTFHLAASCNFLTVILEPPWAVKMTAHHF